LDAATEEIFDRIKGNEAGGPYSWERHLDALKDAVGVYGRGRVSTHIIVGLGETEKDVAEILQWCVDTGICPSLFAFTPIHGTYLENLPQPDICTYRRLQIARYLIVHEETRFDRIGFGEDGRVIDYGIPRENLLRAVAFGKPFLTAGCPGCNRPYYTESPRGPIFNFPNLSVWRSRKKEELEKIHKCF
jgi:biotin synthase-related radical SAM superfamily protein